MSQKLKNTNLQMFGKNCIGASILFDLQFTFLMSNVSICPTLIKCANRRKSNSRENTRFKFTENVITYPCKLTVNKHNGPVVQSIVSLTSPLRGHLVKCFTTLKPNTHIFC